MQLAEETPTASSDLESQAAGYLLAVRGKSVLMVEDNPDICAFVGRFIEYFGATIDYAKNGLEGVDKALSGQYDVVLMDIAMPVCDGIEATQRLRRNGYEGSVIAMTAHPIEGGLRRCFELGFDEYLQKPVNRMRLLHAVALEPHRHRKDPSSLH